MTLESKREYTQLMRERYQRAGKKEKSQILDEFIKVLGHHRKAAIRTLLKLPKNIEQVPRQAQPIQRCGRTS